jgi:thiamine-phosphate pyrophosphorylase
MRSIDDAKLRSLLHVYFVMGSPNCAGDPVNVLNEAIQGGITLFQFREKGRGALQGEGKYALAKELQKLCRRHEVPFIVDDDVELAVRLGADGIHIGQDDEPADIVRALMGGKIIGVSVHSHEEALAAVRDGADYLGLGPIFPTQTKEDARLAQGLTLIKELRSKRIVVPLVGIGGITADNAELVIGAGADGVAVISDISQAEHAAERTKKLSGNVHSAIRNLS